MGSQGDKPEEVTRKVMYPPSSAAIIETETEVSHGPETAKTTAPTSPLASAKHKV